MLENLQTVLAGKAVSIKGKNYFSTAAYVQPFVDRMNTFNATFECNVKMPDIATLTDADVDITYTRVSVSAILPKQEGYSYRRVLTMAYALDVKTPIVKFYIGALTDDDTFITFDKNAIEFREIEPEIPINYGCITSLLERSDNIERMIRSLKDVYIHKDQLPNKLGEWIDFTIDACFINPCGKVKLSSTMPIDVYKMILKDQASDFYIHDDFEISIYDTYNAFLSLIRDDDKDIINRFEKTILVDLLLKL